MMIPICIIIFCNSIIILRIFYASKRKKKTLAELFGALKSIYSGEKTTSGSKPVSQVKRGDSIKSVRFNVEDFRITRHTSSFKKGPFKLDRRMDSRRDSQLDGLDRPEVIKIIRQANCTNRKLAQVNNKRVLLWNVFFVTYNNRF